VRFRGFTYGKIEPGPPEVGPERSFRALDPAADRTRFVVWNDTHENAATLQSLHRLTEAAAPDFLLWNGDQSNDIHEESTMTAQFLAPAGLAIADRRPLAYVRGNHDVRGPAARRLTQFTGTPGDRYYYGFRSGPLAALVLDTGEDKPDDSVWLGGLTDFAALRREQAAWLAKVVREPWFTSAPYRVLFCHIPLWFTRELKAEWAEYSKPCRDAWLPTLVAAGVKLVISGHTHAPAWMPAKADQPIAQLIGGGPRPAQATILHGDADRRRLRLELRRLDGSIVHEAAVPA
jgi:3',5'-cyclic AMP phosphodiesterase CpdA